MPGCPRVDYPRVREGDQDSDDREGKDRIARRIDSLELRIERRPTVVLELKKRLQENECGHADRKIEVESPAPRRVLGNNASNKGS